jgi:hypothetical protein
MVVVLRAFGFDTPDPSEAVFKTPGLVISNSLSGGSNCHTAQKSGSIYGPMATIFHKKIRRHPNFKATS